MPYETEAKGVNLTPPKQKTDPSLNSAAGDVNKLTQDENDNLNKETYPNDLNFQRHTGIDAQRISPRDFLGFQITRVVPTFNDIEGRILLYWDGMTTYRLYARINKGWRFVNLT